MQNAETIRAWLKQTLATTGLSPAAWAKLAGVAPSTIQRALKDNYEFITSSRTLSKLADVAGVAPPSIALLTESSGTKSDLEFLPIRYEVGAGIWRAVEDVDEFYGSGPVHPDPAFAGFAQWMERVVTDSMDLDYPIGTLIHVVDAIGIGYAARSGDHVVIERKQDGGLAERSVKEVRVTRAGLELICRSSNPRWAGSVAVHEGQDEDHCTVAIVALVLGSYRSRRTS